MEENQIFHQISKLRLAKIRLDSDDHLPSNKKLEFHNKIITVRPVFHESNKYYPEIFSDDFILNHLSNVCMLDYGRIDVSESINTNKKKTSRECNCHYSFFLRINICQNYKVVTT